MALPEQIQRQVDDAAKLVEQLQADAPSPSAEVPVSEAGNVVQLPTQGAEVEAAVPSPVTPSPAPQSTSAAPQTTDKEYADLLQRHRSLQGMYNSLDVRFRETTSHLENMRNALAATQQQAKTPEITVYSGVSDKERTDYTPEFFEMMSRWLDNQLGMVVTRLNNIEASINQRVGPAVNSLSSNMQSLANQQALTAEQHYFADLTARVPDWERINTPEGIAWLQETDPMTGVSRQAYLDDARKKLDLARTISIVNAFKAGASAGASQSPPASTSGAELARQAGPAHTRSPKQGATTAENERMYSRADLDKLYSDYRRGVYKGRDAEFRKKEEDMIAAMNSGRYIR